MTAKQWCIELSQRCSGHPADCCCDHCKHGHESFVIPQDIQDIKDEAFRDGLLEAAAICLSVNDAESERTRGIPTTGEYGIGCRCCMDSIRSKANP